MTTNTLKPTTELADRLWFEALIFDLSARFVNLPAAIVDSSMEEMLRLFCERFNVDRATLWQQPRDDSNEMMLTHSYQQANGERGEHPLFPSNNDSAIEEREVSRIPVQIDAGASFPWTLRQMQRGEAVVLSSVDQLPDAAKLDQAAHHRAGTRSLVAIPLVIAGKCLGFLMFTAIRDGRSWDQDLVRRFQLIANLMANVLARKRANQELLSSKEHFEGKLRKSLEEIETLRARLRTENDYVKVESKVGQSFGDITGQSPAMRKVLYQVQQVAPTDSTVLICGETGVGKELFAEAIHGLSSRKNRMLVKVNCAALPQPLVESELFGREKGAYTGALAQQHGRFDLADQSSIFLDEVGELSLEAQAKLLRVLEEGSFERLGSPRTIKVNVRLIAATNRDLVEEARKGRFRQDLLYRLNVFPIRVPPLRERLEDIPLLLWTFVEELSERMGKKITRIPRDTMEKLQRHSWPGNVRELRNVIERGLIISTGETLRVPPLQELQKTNGKPLTLADSQREHILRVLEQTLWHVKGPHGAAQQLGLKPSTLYTRMQKLGIPNRRQRTAFAP